MTIYKGKIAGDLIVCKGDDVSKVTSVGGSLDISADAKLDALTSVGGSLYIRADAKLDALTSVGGSLDIRADAKLDALTSVGGYPIPSAEIINSRMKVIAEKVVNAPQLLTMDSWHDNSECGTTHCLAGWAVHLEPGGYDLEKKSGSTLLAGNILLGPAVSSLFFAEKGKVLAALQTVLAGE